MAGCVNESWALVRLAPRLEMVELEGRQEAQVTDSVGVPAGKRIDWMDPGGEYEALAKSG
jgi:hypothetical protein